jgi:hypothetical protein
MSAAQCKLFLAACVVFAAGASLPLLLRSAATSLGLLEVLVDAPRIEALEHRRQVWRGITEAKGKVLDDLLAGQLTLRQAAGKFARLNDLLEDGNDDLLGPSRVFSGEEALCRNVLAWAEGEAWRRTELAPDLARLKEEYRKEFGHPPGYYPAVPPAP